MMLFKLLNLCLLDILIKIRGSFKRAVRIAILHSVELIGDAEIV